MTDDAEKKQRPGVSDLRNELEQLRAENARLQQASNEAVAQRNRLIFDHVEGWAEAGSLWNFLVERGLFDEACEAMPDSVGRQWMDRMRKLETVTGQAQVLRQIFPHLDVVAPEFNALYATLDEIASSPSKPN